MAREDITVKVEGLARLRRDLRALDRAAVTEVRDVLRDAAGIVAERAALLAPRQTGALAASYKPFTAGNRAGVRSRLPYAGVVEYGGTIRPRGTPIEFRRALPLTRAAQQQADTIVQRLDRGLGEAAARHGWK